MPATGSMRARIKQAVRRALEEDDPGKAWEALAGLPARPVSGTLLLFICRTGLAKWRAVTLLGQAVFAATRDDLEPGRELLRRLWWSLNEESGSIGWGAPEAMAETMARRPPLAREFVNPFISYLRPGACFLEFAPLQRGVIWGLGRMAQDDPELLRQGGAVTPLLGMLAAPDHETRGLAAWALGLLGAVEARAALEALAQETAPLLLFRSGELEPATVGGLAREALARLN